MFMLCFQEEVYKLDNRMAFSLDKCCFTWPRVNHFDDIFDLELDVAPYFLIACLSVENTILKVSYVIFSRVNENTSFCSILEKHFMPGPWNHQLKEFCADQLDCLKLFIRKYPKVGFFTFYLVEIQYKS
jgi:hypothetical protein